ncbi:MAG: hypothetical protein RR661_01175, partial [Anaerovoracaceae bacterium]
MGSPEWDCPFLKEREIEIGIWRYDCELYYNGNMDWIWILVRLLPTALAIYAGVMAIELGIGFILKKKIEIKIFNWLCQFLWILIIVSILKITGIIGGSFGISSPFDSYIS